MAKEITDEDLDLLGELGVEAEPQQVGGRSAREQRILAGFEEIERFVREHGRNPEHGEGRDIFERLYAVRLDQIRQSEECRAVMQNADPLGLLGSEPASKSSVVREDPTDDELLAALGVETHEQSDLTNLVHVRSREEINAAEEVAQRTRCVDFDLFAPEFEQVQQDLKTGRRKTIKYQDNAEVKKGDLFVLDGQKVLIAGVGEPFVNDYGRRDQRLRVIFANGTESDLLVRSLQRALNKDKESRRITEPDWIPLFSGEEEEDDLHTGYIYVLRSHSENPFIAEQRTLIHKIGVTGGDVKNRIGNAKKDPTYLLADVEIVATFKLANINRKKLEALLHKFFAGARLDLALKDRFGSHVEPREWFLVPLPVIEEAIQKLTDGTLGGFRYEPGIARIVKA
jgi:T5orf172 domain